MALSESQDLSGLARGLAFRLTENLGVLRRDTAAAEIKALDQDARGQLRKYGVRFGAFNLYFPALLKPAAAELLLLLWALHGGQEHGLDADGLPERPQQGLTSVAADKAIPEPYWRAAGFHVAGNRAVRIDMLERLSDLIRARVTWRAAEGGEAEAAPSGATGDGGFRVVPELMSMVGCSGDEFGSILRALGFRLERRKREGGNGVAAPAPAAEAAEAMPTAAPSTEDAASAEATAQAEEAVSSEPVFDEIWRPSRRKETHRPPHAKQRGPHAKQADASGKRPPRHGKGQARARGKGQDRGQARAHDRQLQAKPERVSENSPFAALKELRDSLAARSRSEQS